VRKPLPIVVNEDFEAWERYGGGDYRWVFNKLEVALRGGLHAGPSGSAPAHDGLYISRPVYNLYGMGIGAEQFSYSQKNMRDEMIQLGHVPPGNFWCEWVSGEHLSIDYQQYNDGSWAVASVWQGAHYTDTNLTKFRSWTRLSSRAALLPHQLPLDIDWMFDPEVPYFNIEMRGSHVVEVHLRPGDAMFNKYPVGTSLLPVWRSGSAEVEGEWIPDIDEDMSKHNASGHLTEVRDGFIVVRNNHQ
jgi:hypothetical protein